MRRPHRHAALDPGLLTLLEQAGENIRDVARLLRDMLVDYPEHAALIGEVQDREHRGDRIARDIIHRLSPNGNGGRRRAGPHSRQPLDPQRIRRARAGDGARRHRRLRRSRPPTRSGSTASRPPMEQSVALAEILVAGVRRGRAARSRRSVRGDGGRTRASTERDPPASKAKATACCERWPGVPVRQRDRPDGRHPLEGHLRVAGVVRGRMPNRCAPDRGHLAHPRTAPPLACADVSPSSGLASPRRVVIGSPGQDERRRWRCCSERGAPGGCGATPNAERAGRRRQTGARSRHARAMANGSRPWIGPIP